MGTVLQYCTGAEEMKIKLEKAEKDNESLRQQLIEAQEAYHRLQSKRQFEEQEKLNKLYNSKKQATQQYLREQKEREKLQQKLEKQGKRESIIDTKLKKLAEENKKLQQELNARSDAAITEEEEGGATTTDSDDDNDDNDNNNNDEQSIEEEKDFSPRTDMVSLRNWLVYKNLGEKDLKTELAKLLSMRSESHRSKIPEAYKQRYGADIMDDIGKIMKKGNVYTLVDGLFRTKAEYDAVCIREIVTNTNNKLGAVEVGDILCCRNVNELQLICHEYKKLYNKEMKDKIYKLSSGKTYQFIINQMFLFKRNDNETTNKMKIAAKVQGDVEFLMDKNRKWKKYENKQKLALIFLANNKEYINDLNSSFFKQSNLNLIDFIDSQIGDKSTSGKWMKTRVEFCSDSADFYARKIQIAGDDGWNKGRSSIEINRIFVSQFDGELKKIKKKFDKLNYGNGKSMIEWVNKSCKNEKYAFFLTKILENCHKI